MEFHPKYIGATCIYVAGKVEEQYISVETLVKSYEGVESDVIAHEMIVLEGVRFQLIMYHPFRSLTGFIDDLRAHSKSTRHTDVPISTLQTLHATATAVINDLLLTDAPLLYPPAVVALAGLQVATTVEMAIDWTKYLLACKRGQGQSMHEVVQAIQEVVQLRAAREADAAASEAELKSAYKKLKGFYKSTPKKAAADESKEPKAKKHKSSDGKKSKKSKKGVA
ncbi:hypothetical protein DYB30_003537 [Aphanomyces astaci]|uniref:Cyclin C-terminal domain-containing protein n=1 Tax=Aphanomyces astaci TaxID=112090 RepID=A0A397DPS3_APHAT|nr:hypothetical protein DYB30_003537 [Aphanomyces astaci]